MDISEVKKVRSFRLLVLVKMYEVANGKQSYSFNGLDSIQDIVRNVDRDDLIPSLQFLAEKNYIHYIDASTQSGIDMLDIRLRSKGIELAERIFLHENTSQYKADFPSIVINYYYEIHDIDGSKVILGDSNTQ